MDWRDARDGDCWNKNALFLPQAEHRSEYSSLLNFVISDAATL
jgi:hypothetical protein